MREAYCAWLAVLTVAQLAPVALCVIVGTGEPATMWSNIAVVTGVQAMAAMVAAVLLASRFRSITGAFGIDGAMVMHRVFGGAAAALALAHIVAVIGDNPANVWLLDVTSAPARAVSGTVALALLAALVVFAGRRRRRYEWWRWAHRIVAAAAAVLVVLHVCWLGRLVESVWWLCLFVVLALALLTAVAWRWMPLDEHRAKFVVADIWPETETVSTVSLLPCVPARFEFEAGQFAWLRLARTSWTQDHPFTMTSAPGSPCVEFTFRHAGDFTSGPLRGLRPGAPVWLDGPHGAMTLAAADDAAGFVMVAAGVGLAPIMSTLRALDLSGDPRPVWVLIPPAEPLFRDDLQALAQRLDLSVLRALSRPVTAGRLGEVLPDLDGLACYVAGPPALVSAAADALAELDVPPGRVLTEQFEIV